MKKVFFFCVGLMGISIFAQDISMSDTSGIVNSGSSSNVLMTLGGFLFYGLLYVGVPVFFYCISSYSLGLLNKHYNKKKSSKISWVPFIRYYSFIKDITKSSKKAFMITLLPWIITVGSFLILMALGIMGSHASSGIAGNMYISMNVMAILTLIGAISIIAMSVLRAFIISKYVKGDTTTALGLSTYTTLILWYIALDRIYKKTDVIGITGFIVLGLIICFYITIFLTFGLSGVESFLGA